MLILKRKEGQSINIHTAEGDLITITVWPDGRSVRVGIAAPEHIKILRAELEPAEVTA
jgi:carbon storage regulator CsrA